MKKFTKLLVAVLLAVLTLSLTACGSSQKRVLTQDEELNLSLQAMQMFNSIISLSDEEIDAYIDDFEYAQETVYTNGFNSWKSAKKELGECLEIGDATTTVANDGSTTTTFIAEFENRDCEFVLGFDRRMQKITELTFNPVYTLGEKMSQAGVNLVVGMGTVFAVLIFLTLIISLFKYVNIAEEKLQQKKSKAVITETAAKTAPAAASKAAQAAVDSNEIQAVIAAAIAAYESECGGFEKQPALNNGLVIRSYKRS